MTKGTWRKFEELTEDIFKKLLQNPSFEKVERDVKVPGKEGLRQIDVLITTRTAGLNLKTAIECKDHKSKISIGTVDAFHSKLMDINANKGIIVSSNGFSSKAIAKAKRLGISLYTAHEALSDKWKIEIEIPVLVHEIIPWDIGGNFIVPENSRYLNQKFPFGKREIWVNGMNVLETVRSLWSSNQLDFKMTEEEQVICIPNLKSPFILSDPSKTYPDVEVDDLNITIQLKINFYLGFLNEVEDSQLINDITEGHVTFFMKTFPIYEYQNVFRKIKKTEIPNNKLSIQILSKFEIPEMKLGEVGLIRDGKKTRFF